MKSFTTWLKTQRAFDTPIGDLARDWSDDCSAPTEVKSLEQLRNYLTSKRACEGALEAAREAWPKYASPLENCMQGTTPYEVADSFLETALLRCPSLTANGIDGKDGPLGAEYRNTAVNQIRLCANWLTNHQIIGSFNRRYDSYKYKHIVERMHGTYISNGALIAAAIGLGLQWERQDWRSLNVYLPLSERTVKLLWK